MHLRARCGSILVERVQARYRIADSARKADGMHIAIQIADQTAEDHLESFRDRLVEMGWKTKMSSS